MSLHKHTSCLLVYHVYESSGLCTYARKAISAYLISIPIKCKNTRPPPPARKRAISPREEKSPRRPPPPLCAPPPRRQPPRNATEERRLGNGMLQLSSERARPSRNAVSSEEASTRLRREYYFASLCHGGSRLTEAFRLRRYSIEIIKPKLIQPWQTHPLAEATPPSQPREMGGVIRGRERRPRDRSCG